MKRLVVFTGAGVSKESGIPTFEELDIRDKLSRDYFLSNPEDFYRTSLIMYKTIKNAEPNAAHLAIAEYDLPVVTMNIDMLHKRAGSKHVVELHGSLEEVHCRVCRRYLPFDEVEKSIRCDCGRVYDHDVVLYGDSIPRLEEAYDTVDGAKELLVIGTSMVTSTSSYIIYYAKGQGAKITMINDNAATKVPEYLRSIFG